MMTSPVLGSGYSPLLYFCAIPISDAANTPWTPAANPDAQRIHHEAGDDRRAKRYEDALAKTLWFHEHGLEFEQSLASAAGARQARAVKQMTLTP